MQKLLAFVLAVVLILPFSGCTSSTAEPEVTPPITQIANPWKDWSSIAEAEQVVGFSFGLPDRISDRYAVDTIRTMNTELIEVIYRDEEFKVRVRKQKGEGQDISGDYNQYDTRSESHINGGTVIQHSNTGSNAAKHLISCNGFSWSLVAANGYHADADRAFLSSILEQPLA